MGCVVKRNSFFLFGVKEEYRADEDKQNHYAGDDHNGHKRRIPGTCLRSWIVG